jgi:hypothetical protein
MIITNDRTQLDSSIDDNLTTVFILLGEAGSAAAAVHQEMTEMGWDDWQRYFLIAAVTDEERKNWFLDETSDRYVVLGGAVKKNMAVKGSSEELLTEGLPDRMKIADAMLKGDEERRA